MEEEKIKTGYLAGDKEEKNNLKKIVKLIMLFLTYFN